MTAIADFQMQEDGRRRRYFLPMPNGEDARLTLVKTSSTHWIADHTFVPVPYRGGDIAMRLVERLVADARSEGAKVSATCWYVADVFKLKSPEWDDIRA